MRLLFVIFFLFSFYSISQTYTGGTLKADGKNYGKNVTVVYDTFFDTFKITYTNSDNIRITEKFNGDKFVKSTEVASGKSYYFLGSSTNCFIHMNGYPYYWITNLKKNK